MSKRKFKPIFPHGGFTYRQEKRLSTGEDLLYCTERRTATECMAVARRDPNGVITVQRDHTGHDSNECIVQAKLARIEMKKMAEVTEMSPKEILLEEKKRKGTMPIVVAGKVGTLRRMISRVREDSNADTKAVDSVNPVFQGRQTRDNENDQFLLFDIICNSTSSRHVGFATKLGLEILEKSAILLTDGTFSVAQPPFCQLWCVHGEFAGAILPLAHVLMGSRTIADYEAVILEFKKLIGNWDPEEYMGDLEIGQAKAIKNCFPRIQLSYCYFHLLQCWRRKLQALHLDSLIDFNGLLYDFWTLLRCLPFGDPASAQQDFQLICGTLPTTQSAQMKDFVVYMKKYYVGPGTNLKFPPDTWNVASRTLRNVPRTTNSVEASHRNLDHCVHITRGRAPPLISELLQCMRDEGSQLLFDKEALDINPNYDIFSPRKLKDVSKDARLLAVLQNTGPRAPRGLAFFKAVRAAKNYK